MWVNEERDECNVTWKTCMTDIYSPTNKPLYVRESYDALVLRALQPIQACTVLTLLPRAASRQICRSLHHLQGITPVKIAESVFVSVSTAPSLL